MAAIVVQSAKFAEKIMLNKVRQFEKACDKWDRNSKSKLLPVKEDGQERPERVIISLMTDISMNDVKEISKESTDLKKMIKVPMLLFVTGAAMLASLSDLQIKLITAVLEDAKEV